MFGYQLDDSQKQDWENHVYGDIGGVVFPKTDGCKKLLKDLSELWLGLQMSDLQACVRRRHKEENSGLGVVVITYGIEKAELLKEAITKGTVSHLVVDNELGAELLRTSYIK